MVRGGPILTVTITLSPSGGTMTKKAAAKKPATITAPTFDKLNLGCGKVRLPGYDNIDISDGRNCSKLAEYADESVTEVRASHILEHFPHATTLEIMREWARVLKPGGKLFIAVPDIDKLIEIYESPQACKVPVEKFIYGGQMDLTDSHRAMFNANKLERLLRMAGLVRVEAWKGEHDSSVYPFSLNRVGTKIAKRATPPPVMFVLSCPRLGFSDMWISVVESIKAIPNAIIHKVTGAYWGQALERGMQRCAKEGAEFVIALDYDSVYKGEDIQELLYLADSYPEADALVPLQSARGWDTPLVSINDPETGKRRGKFEVSEFAGPVSPISTGHFGCTLFRSSSLNRFPHPWLHAQPASDGAWGEGKIDADIMFWKRWNALGFKAYMANRVVIGHIEIMVKWPGPEWQTVHQSLSNYNEEGKPNGIWI